MTGRVLVVDPVPPKLRLFGGDAAPLGLSKPMSPRSETPQSQPALPPRRINVDLEYELQYWSRAFGVGREALLAAVQAVGPDARAVSRQLGKG